MTHGNSFIITNNIILLLQNGLSALHMATQGGHAEVVQLLLEEKFPVDDITSVFSLLLIQNV